jgi:hypothetical protein
VSQPPTWLQEAAATGEALAGVALFIAIWRIFVRDPRKSARKQVDELAAWAEPESELQRTPGQPHPAKIRVFLHNASTLPIEIVHVGVDVRSSWVVPDPLHHDKRVGVYKPRDGLKASSMFFRGVRLAPDQTHEQVHTLDISDHAPARSIFLWPDQGIVCEFRTILVIDNAGRRWRLHPGRKGPAKRAPHNRKREDEHEPHYW